MPEMFAQKLSVFGYHRNEQYSRTRNTPLKTWFTIAFLMLHSKKGMSAFRIKRMVFHDKASYQTV